MQNKERQAQTDAHQSNAADVTTSSSHNAKPLVSGCVLKINLTEYGYYCGDRCCYNYGKITTVNGVELPCHNQDAGTILSQVLEHLGYKVEIEYGDYVEKQ